MPNEPENIERRFLLTEVRAAGDEANPIIEGDAAVFNQETTIGTLFRETIRPGAFTRVLSENPDVIAAYNHDWNVVLGRTSSRTLVLTETIRGLHYETKINPKDGEAMNVYQKVKRGDIPQASFAFTVRAEAWTKPQNKGELALREVIEVDKLFDVGPVAFGAYPQASAQARSQAQTFQQAETPSDQAASSGAEEAVKARQAARRRTLELLSATHSKNR
jgi:HK97 family phage prohead protease